MPKQVDDNITDLELQHTLFVLEECDLKPRFKFGIWYRAQVEAGQVWQIYRDGVQYEPLLQAGPHVLWNALWHTWKALRITTRTVDLPFTFDGRVQGPPLPKEDQSTAGVDLGCSVKAAVILPCRIADIEKYLQYERPLNIFYASLRNMVIEMIGGLPYDQFGKWATNLRDQIRERLQNTVELIGVKVEEVYVTKVEPNSLQDRNMVAMYQQVERVRRELAEAQANRQRDTEVARSFADQGNILNIAPSLLALQNSPIGKELLTRDADLRKMMVAAGLNPGVSVTPLRDPQTSLGAGPLPSAGYINPPSTTGQFVPANTGPISFVSGPLSATGGQSGPLSSSTPPGTGGQLIDPDRQERDIAALQAAGFQCAGRGQYSPTYDASGQPIPGSMEWILDVYVQRINGFITVVLNCPGNYPASPPRVQVRTPSSGGLRAITPEVVRTWTPNNMLVEIVREIDDNTP